MRLLIAAAAGLALLAGCGDARSPAAALPAGWRWESWRNVSFAVPGHWEHGALHQRCTGTPPPAVERPGGVSTLMWCAWIGHGVAVSPADDGEPYADVVPFGRGGDGVQTFPRGAAVERVRVGDVHLVAVAPDAATAAAVAGSARLVTGTDPHGCPTAATVPPLGEKVAGTSTATTLRAVTEVSVCRFDLTDAGPLLAASERLDAAGTGAFVAALLGAPRGAGPDAPPGTCANQPPTEVVGIAVDGEPVAWVHVSGCSRHGVDLLDGTPRRVTDEVLYWALSPGWSGALHRDRLPDGFPRR